MQPPELYGAAHRPRVSVLMPTFKQAAFIRRALESLRARTYADGELVIVDDGSPDETDSVVAPYLADPRLRYHRLARNRGLGAALNIATGLACGQYLAYLPSDDPYYPDHLARLWRRSRCSRGSGWRTAGSADPVLVAARRCTVRGRSVGRPRRWRIRRRSISTRR